MIVGAGLVLSGILLMVVTGPGLLVLFFGLGIIGTGSLLVISFMDWAEVRVRKLFKRDRNG